jgi:hypothetical protein
VSDETIDRTSLPIQRPAFSGVAEQTLGGSQPDWEQIGHVKPPEGAPNVLVVLIDDAGFGNPGYVRRADRYSELRSDRRSGAAVQPFSCDGDVLADAGGVVDGS